MFKSSYTVLLVDDEYSTCKLLNEKINSLENVTVVASLSNGLEAKKYLMEHVVDMVFTDIRMPYFDGLQLAEYINNHIAFCPVVIISGFDDFEYARQAIKSDVKNYLLKPVRLQQIKEAVEKCKCEINKHREFFLKLKNDDERFENELFASFSKSKNNAIFRELLSENIPGKGFVASIELEESINLNNYDISMFYKNLLADALPGNKIVRLLYSKNQFDYLILPENKEYTRTVNAIPEYISRILKNNLCFNVLFEFNNSLEFEDRYSSVRNTDTHVLISKACKFIEDNLETEITRDIVAKQIFLSSSYFSRIFKRTMGKSFSNYLLDLRIDKAKEFLKKDIKVSDIAKMVGFHDSKYFSMVFQEKTGFTPSEYRKIML